MDKKENKLTIVLSIVVAALVIAGAIIYAFRSGGGTGGQSGKTDLAAKGLLTAGLPLRGDAKAPVTIVEFGDFQCVACVQFFATVEPQLKKELIDTGKANMAFKPLTFIDQFASKDRAGESWMAAQAAECAADQGKFWEMHDAIYQAELNEVLAKKNNENSGNLTKSFFVNTAVSLKLNSSQFTSCLDSQTYTDKIDGFMADAQKAMGNQISTPTLFVIKDGVATQMKGNMGFDVNAYVSLIASSTK